MKSSKLLVVIAGPTAVGKTGFAIKLAERLETDIISCDSRQFYRQTDIGTAKPMPDELGRVTHHFIDSLDLEDDYNAGDFERDALQLLQQLFEKHEVVLMCGGSGLYIRALCEGFDELPPTTPETRRKITEAYQLHGIGHLQRQLQQLDPAYHQIVDLNNPQRLIRALEICTETGKPFSSFHKGGKAPRPFRTLKICLFDDREALYGRINRRVDSMMAAGLLQEARGLYAHRQLNALQTVGYSELFAHLNGETSLERAVELIKRNTRRYAKRQLTWFRKDPDMHWLAPNDSGAAWELVQAAIRGNGYTKPH